MDYPKLLIINNYSFNEYKGGGITLKNLFMGWPKDKLAIAHMSESVPMPVVCEKYYKIGYNEYQYIYPLNKISTEPRGKLNGAYSVHDFAGESDIKTQFASHNFVPTANPLKRWFLNFIETSGLREVLHPLKLSEQLENWISEFNPDIIYCQPENISFINLIIKSQRLTNAKVVVHVMDDWPYMVYRGKSLQKLLRYWVDKRFRKLLKKASLRLGISKAMAEEFESRYALKFGYFHNPIDISLAPERVLKPKADKEFLVVYSGRIGVTASHDSIIGFAEAVSALRKKGYKIRFNVYTDLDNKENDFSKFGYDGTSLLPALRDHNFITSLQEADLLLYPVDFDQKSIDFIRLSFPTKLPSYLISGTPVFCYGPQQVYSIRFMAENELGFMCTKADIGLLQAAITNALADSTKQSEYAERAKQFAYTHFESNTVRARFHKALADCAVPA